MLSVQHKQIHSHRSLIPSSPPWTQFTSARFLLCGRLGYQLRSSALPPFSQSQVSRVRPGVFFFSFLFSCFFLAAALFSRPCVRELVFTALKRMICKFGRDGGCHISDGGFGGYDGWMVGMGGLEGSQMTSGLGGPAAQVIHHGLYIRQRILFLELSHNSFHFFLSSFFSSFSSSLRISSLYGSVWVLSRSPHHLPLLEGEAGVDT